MGNGLSFWGLTGACSLLIGVLFTVGYVNDVLAGKGRITVIQDESFPMLTLEDNNNGNTANSPPAATTMSSGYIGTIALWKHKQNITISVQIEDGVKHSQEIKAIVLNAINGNRTDAASSTTSSNDINYTAWNSLLHAVLKSQGRDIIIHAALTDRENPDIVITITNREDDKGRNAYGRTVMTLDSHDHNNLSFVNIIVFKADEQYERHLLAPVITHELGHALGLQHSNSEKSIMYPRVVIVDNRPYSTIEECEYNAINALYVHLTVGSVSCDNNNNNNDTSP